MTGKTIFEDLPPEVWLNIFAYLNSREQFKGFFNLKLSINSLLLDYIHHVKVKENDEDSQYVLDHILPRISQSNYVSSLRLESIHKMNIFQNIHFFYFPNLRSLTLCHLHITNDILNLLRYYSPYLEYLDVSSFVSNRWIQLLESILSFTKLQICYLNLNMILCRMKSLFQSPVKHLTLLSTSRTCSLKNITTFLNHFHSLDSLHIECSKIINDEVMNTKPISLSYFYLQVNSLPELFTDFMLFLTTTISRVEKLHIKCCQAISNFVYVKIIYWIKLIDSLDNLNELILFFRPNNKIIEKTWNRRCNEIMAFTKIRNITFRIVSLEK
ncbi:hypothetical protein I4U23_001712 [Adineta vaga]|nr:hypothetical protein I4U23_001712 [Adineta vaga]